MPTVACSCSRSRNVRAGTGTPSTRAHWLVLGALGGGNPGRYALQAAIAALHAQAPSYAETDWPQVLTLYDALLKVWPSPVVALNRAVAVAMVRGPEARLGEVEALEHDGRLAGYRYLPATKADLLRRLGRHPEAALAYRAALDLADNEAERAVPLGPARRVVGWSGRHLTDGSSGRTRRRNRQVAPYLLPRPRHGVSAPVSCLSSTRQLQDGAKKDGDVVDFAVRRSSKLCRRKTTLRRSL